VGADHDWVVVGRQAGRAGRLVVARRSRPATLALAHRSRPATLALALTRRSRPAALALARRSRPATLALATLAFAAILLAASPALGDPVGSVLKVRLPGRVSSPPVDPAAPYTPLVKSLLHQLEPAQPDPETDAAPAIGTTGAELTNADKLLHGTSSSVCTTVGSNLAPTGTTPAIAPLCWSDALGLNVTFGAQVRQTTAPPLRVAMSSSWNPALLNAWGQVEGSEGRWLGVTGIYGPQADLLRIPNWGRNGTILGEDPFEDGTLAAAEVNGIQGKGLMSQIKHFAMYNGQVMFYPTDVQDQAAHQMFLQPYEYGTTGSGALPRPGQASSMMCSYQRYGLVAAPGVSKGPPSELSPATGAFSCDNQLKNYAAHGEWHWPGFFASDYDLAMDSTIQAIESGTDQEMPTQIWFGPPLVAAVEAHVVPLSTFNLAIARILDQEERFHLLGHADANSNYLSPSHPTDGAGRWALTQAQKTHDGGIVERASEEGAVLLKNAKHALPITRRNLRKGILVVGDSAEYMPADPGTEQAVGYPDRDAISPLEQLRQLAPRHSRITYLPFMPGSEPTVGDGVPIPRSALSTNGTTTGNGLERTAGPGSPRVDRQVNFTKLSGRGQLAPGATYTWSGYINVPKAQDYTFRFQFSVPTYTISRGGGSLGNGGGGVTPPACTGSGAPGFSLASSPGVGQKLKAETLASAPNTISTTPTNPTMAGYTERGLANCLFEAATLSPGMHQIQLTWTTPSSLSDPYHLREPGSTKPSLRFAYTRASSDEAATVAAARRASKVIVFADCTCVTEDQITSPAVNALDYGPSTLIRDVASANRNTIVVTNFDVATLMPWLSSVRAVLQMWYPGSEGGTATARLLLGKADPEGHLTSTWPATSTDTIFGYHETIPLYSGDSTGAHSERLPSTPPVNFSEGIFIGYRFFDREGLRPLFPFGFGLSYTRFRFSHLRTRRAGRGFNISFDVTNRGSVAGAEVAQVYLGSAPHVPTGIQQAVRSLAGFDRVVLSPHQTKRITIHIGPGADRNGNGDRRAFQYWDTATQTWITAGGRRRLWVGDADSASHLPLSARIAGA
jgi:beta-glucosidase